MGAWNGPDPLGGFDNWIGGVLGTLRGWANAALQWLKSLWDFLWNHILKALLNALLRLQARLAKLLAPILKWIQRIRDWEIQNWNLYVKPILNFIQRLRSALLIFRLFHFKWAAALDTRLAGIESQLTQLWLNVYADLNRVLSYFDYILDPTGYFRAGVYLATAIKSIGGLWSIVMGAPSQPLPAGVVADQAHDATLCDFQVVLNNITATPAGDVADDYSRRYEDIWTRLQAMGYTRPS